MTDSQRQQNAAGLSQSTYRGTPYEDSAWEVVGEFQNQESFEPLEFKVVTEQDVKVDPMFADYGGLTPTQGAVRFHGADACRFSPSKRKIVGAADPEDVVKVPTITVTEHERLLAAARAEEREAGKIDAIAEADERMKVVEERYIAIFEDIATQITENLRGIEQQAVQLALQISQKLITSIVDINPEYILDVVREALKQAGGAAIKSIRVSPQDHEFLRLLNLPKHVKEFDGTWEFEADPAVKSGCIVTTSAGEVDFQIDAAWERVRDHVVKVTAG